MERVGIRVKGLWDNHCMRMGVVVRCRACVI